MIMMFRKLAFAHRVLWARGGRYRVAVLLGPAPLVGFALAAAVWVATAGLRHAAETRSPWAEARNPADGATGSEKIAIVPTGKPLPPLDPGGRVIGYRPGWQLTISPIEVSASLDVDVKQPLPGSFSVEGPSIDMTQITAVGPKGMHYVGVGRANLVIKTPGVYGLTVRLDRVSAPPADCLARMGVVAGRAVSELTVGMIGTEQKTFQISRFELQPGLYPIAWAFGCWNAREMVAAGKLTVLISRPGSAGVVPALPNDFAY